MHFTASSPVTGKSKVIKHNTENTQNRVINQITIPLVLYTEGYRGRSNKQVLKDIGAALPSAVCRTSLFS